MKLILNKYNSTYLIKQNQQMMEKELKTVEKKVYISPDIEVVEIEIEQNILQAGSGDLPGLPGENW